MSREQPQPSDKLAEKLRVVIENASLDCTGGGDYSICRPIIQNATELARTIIPLIEQEVRENIIEQLKSNNPFVGYVDVVENIRMAKEQGWDRAWQSLKGGNHE